MRSERMRAEQIFVPSLQVGPGPGEAVLGISNVDLNAAGTLHFSFGLDTPAADPSPNLRLVSDFACL